MKKFSLLLGLILFLFGCEVPVDIDDLPIQSGKPVIISNFSNSGPIFVFVSKTYSPITESDNFYYSDLKIELTELNSRKTYILSSVKLPDLPPAFVIGKNHTPAIGDRYEIKVSEVPGFDKTLSAISFIPKPVEAKIVTFDYEEKKNHFGSTIVNFTVKVEIDDPKFRENFYQLNFFQKMISDLPDKTLPLQINYDDNDYSILPYLSKEGVLIKDEEFNGTRAQLTFSGTFIYSNLSESPGNFFFELRTLSKEYYQYHSSYIRQTQAGSDPLAEPVLLNHNIKNGYGNFAGYAIALDSTSLHQ